MSSVFEYLLCLEADDTEESVGIMDRLNSKKAGKSKQKDFGKKLKRK